MPRSNLIRELVTDNPPEGLARLRAELASNAALLKKFCDQPGKVLQDYGIKADKSIKLGDREKAMVRLFFDDEVMSLYRAGDLDTLRSRIIDRHPDLGIVNPTDLAGAIAYVDVDVAVVAEAVAVAVAVVAIAVTGAIEPRDRIAGAGDIVTSAATRVAALEARVKLLARLESRLATLERRIR